MYSDNFCIGMDFGTDSVRTIIVNAKNGETCASAVHAYQRWRLGQFCDPDTNQFRQHPLDHIDGLETTITQCLDDAGLFVKKNIRSISVASTGSSPLMVDRNGTPLSMLPQFSGEPDAMIMLWKDHSAVTEASDINKTAKFYPHNYLKYSGGIYSSEWYWSKLLYIIRHNEEIRHAGYTFVEHCDWIPFLLTGGTDAGKIKRSVCSAGHKALWSAEWNGFPPADFFTAVDPFLYPFFSTLSNQTFTADKPAGNLSAAWAEKLGLSTDVTVGIGAIDAHMGAVGGQIEPYYLSKVMGTSTCDMMVAPTSEMNGKYVQGICGLVNGSIIPGMIGMEAGQSAFGDVFAWFKDLLSWSLNNVLPENPNLHQLSEIIIPALSRQAAQLPIDEKGELSVDWFNGRRTPDANPYVRASITGLNLGTDAPRIFKSLVESTCFGAKAIVERFEDEGVPVKGLIGIGGIARKSPFIMQMMSDIIGMPIKINRSEQTGALGAAMFAATVAGVYNKVEHAMDSMGQGFDQEYRPETNMSEFYDKRYRKYQLTGNFTEQNIN